MKLYRIMGEIFGIIEKLSTWALNFSISPFYHISYTNSRVFGFVSELLPDVWIETNRFTYKELPYVVMEDQNRLVKDRNFLKRKLKMV